MESLTLALFVLGLLIAAFLVTQIIRRELKTREQMEGYVRRQSRHMRRAPLARAPRAPHAHGLQQQTHRSPPNSV
jgi:hypothetical protein